MGLRIRELGVIMRNSNPKIAFVVGHSNWGKSRTLRALTGGAHQIRWITFRDHEFLIRRMSNDDLPDDFIDWIESISPANRPYVIAALCPNFKDESAETQWILEDLRDKGYQMYFWVIEHGFGSSEVVTPGEISRLARFGRFEVLREVLEAGERGRVFRAFISDVVL